MGTRLRLGQLLVDACIITQEQLDQTLEAQKRDGRRLGTLLVEQGLINETQLTQILSQQLAVPWVSLYHVDFSKHLLSLVPREIAEKYCLVPIYVRHVRGQGDTLYVAMDDPTNDEALRECSEWSGLPTRAMISSPRDIRSAIAVYYGVIRTRSSAPAAEETLANPSVDTSERAEPELAAPAIEEVEQVGSQETSNETDFSDEPTPIRPLRVQFARPSGQTEEGFSDEVGGVVEVGPVAPAAAASEGQVSEQEPVREFEGRRRPAEQDADSSPPVVPGSGEPAATGAEAARAADGSAQAAASDDEEAVVVEMGEELALEEVVPEAKRLVQQRSGASDSGELRKGAERLMSLTLLDGTRLAVPVRKKQARRVGSGEAIEAHTGETEAAGESTENLADHAAEPGQKLPEEIEPSDEFTARDVIAALRAAAHGVDASELLGQEPKWQSMVAAILSLLIRKGLVMDEEFVRELKRI